ncbi:MAG: hypothetical protein ABIV21_03370 [Pyrinomonadaceae bacterium]
MAELEVTPIDPIDIPPDTEVVIVEEETAPTPIPPNRPRKVYSGMWGPLEISAVAVAFMVLLASIFVYFFWVLPTQREVARNRAEAERLDAEVMSARAKYGDITTTESQVAKIVTSMDDFETRFLPIPAYGQPALYQRLNSLIRAYGLVNTSGPDYAALEAADVNAERQSEEEKGRAKFRSIFPGVYVSTTVEGSYQNLRRFIRELETGRDFIVLSTVELAPSDTENKKEPTNVVEIKPVTVSPLGKGLPATVAGQPGLNQGQAIRRPQGKTHGETVTLRIEMAAYFRRPNFMPALLAE